jgi:hypothetical protein
MAQVHLTPRSIKPWITVMLAAAGASLMWWSLWRDQTQVPASTEQPASMVSATAPAKPAAPAVPRVLDAAGLSAQQMAAAQAVERNPTLKPITGPITERPAFVSEIEWQMLQGVAQQHAAPKLELAHLVNNLRFMKQLELWQSMAPSGDAAKRQTLAEQLLDDLPQRLASGDLDLSQARKLQASFLKDAVSDPEQRKARAEAEARRLASLAVPQASTQQAG